MTKEIPILMYHKFIASTNSKNRIKTFVTSRQFEWQLRILKFLNYRTITFKDLQNISKSDKKKNKYIILTVDDGYKDNYDIMFPLLKKYNMKAVIYLVSGCNYNKWDVEKYGDKRLELLSCNEVFEMIESGLIEFGGHTVNHCDFNTCSLEEAKKEIFHNKMDLEKKYKINLISFAYPYGHLNENVKNIVKESGYKFAVSTDTGSGIIEDDLYEIRRTAIDKTSFFNFLRKISPRYSTYKGKKWLKGMRK